MAHRLELDPTRSVGPFVFGAEARPIIDKYGLKKLDDSDYRRFDWDTYAFIPSDAEVYVENGRIDRVGCFAQLYYKGKNLIGLALDEFRAMFGKEEDVGDEVSGRTPLEFYRYGLQVWIDEGRVESIMCSEAT